jgi:hypothetical protein
VTRPADCRLEGFPLSDFFEPVDFFFFVPTLVPGFSLSLMESSSANSSSTVASPAGFEPALCSGTFRVGTQFVELRRLCACPSLPRQKDTAIATSGVSHRNPEFGPIMTFLREGGGKVVLTRGVGCRMREPGYTESQNCWQKLFIRCTIVLQARMPTGMPQLILLEG